MLAYGSNQGIYQVIGTALTFVASIPAAIAMLKRSDERALVRFSDYLRCRIRGYRNNMYLARLGHR